MNKKHKLATVCALTLTVSAIALGLVRQTQNAQPAPQGKIPEHVIYKHFFHHVIALKRRAEEVEREAGDSSPYRTLYKQKLGLSAEQTNTLNDIAADCEREVLQQDARAKILIEAYKAQYPGGKVPRGESPLPPPAELDTLQAERDAMFLRARDRLRIALGDKEFSRVDEFLKSQLAPNIKALSPDQIPAAAN